MSATADIENTIAALGNDLHRIDAKGLVDHWINQLDGGSDKLIGNVVKELKNLRNLLGSSDTTTGTIANSLQLLSEFCAKAAIGRHGLEIDALRHLNQKLASAAGQIRAGF